jgi:uncharacterized SAM-binding protein YcdF (DUF218 family)
LARLSSARRRRRGWAGWLWRLALLALMWLAAVAAWIVWVGQRDQAAPADAIIVLGAAAYDARPSPVFQERIRHGLDLYRRDYAPVLLFTGGYGGSRARFSESQVARRYALQQGIPESAIMIESVSRTTRQNLIQARQLMQDHGLHRAIVVSDPLHMARALRLCRELGIDAVGSPTPSTRFRTVQTQWLFLLQEVYFFHRDLVLRTP